MLKAYSYRIYPADEQVDHLSQSFGCARFVYNNALAEKIKAYEERKESISSYTLIKRITTLKKEYEWLKVPPAQSLQQLQEEITALAEKAFSHISDEARKKYPDNYRNFVQGKRRSITEYYKNKWSLPTS